MLDKYVKSWDPDADSGNWSERVQKPALDAVIRRSAGPPLGLDYNGLMKR